MDRNRRPSLAMPGRADDCRAVLEYPTASVVVGISETCCCLKESRRHYLDRFPRAVDLRWSSSHECSRALHSMDCNWRLKC